MLHRKAIWMQRRFGALLAALAGLSTPLAAHAEVPVAIDLELFELHVGSGDTHLVFEGAVTAGSGPDFVIGELEGGSDIGARVDEVEALALYGRDIGNGITLLAGARHDFRDGDDLNHATAGFEAEIGAILEAEALMFLSEDGDLTGITELVAGWRLTEGLTIEPRLVVLWSAQDMAQDDGASGLTEMELSARLRQQVTGFLEVYAGVAHERLLAGTRRIALDAGDRAAVTLFVIGGGASF